MRVARRRADQYSGDAVIEEGVGVGAVVGVDAVLEGDSVRLCHVRQPPEQPPVVMHARILMHKGRAAAEVGGVLLLLHGRHIADEANIEGDGEVEVVAVRHRLRAMHPALLLHRRAEPEVVLERLRVEIIEQQVHDGEQHPVVHRLADNPRAKAPHRPRPDDARANVDAPLLHFRPAFRADVHEEIVEVEVRLIELRLGERVAAGSGEDALRHDAMPPDDLRELPDHEATVGRRAARALRGVEEEEALLRDVADDEADLVHVRLDEQFRPAPADTAEDIADGVLMPLGHPAAPPLPQPDAHRLLLPRRTGNRRQFCEEINNPVVSPVTTRHVPLPSLTPTARQCRIATRGIRGKMPSTRWKCATCHAAGCANGELGDEGAIS